MSTTSRSSISREDIVATALSLLDDDGADAVSLAEIARRLGVTQPAMYHHVDGLDDLWRALGIEIRQELSDKLAQATIGLAGPSAVRAVAATWRHYARSNPGRYQCTSRHPVGRDLELEAAVDRVLDVIALSLRAFELSPDQERRAAHTIRSALHGFVDFELVDSHPHPDNNDETFDHVIEYVLVAINALANGELAHLDEDLL